MAHMPKKTVTSLLGSTVTGAIMKDLVCQGVAIQHNIYLTIVSRVLWESRKKLVLGFFTFPTIFLNSFEIYLKVIETWECLVKSSLFGGGVG